MYLNKFVDSIFNIRSIEYLRVAASVAFGSLFLALIAQFSIPLPFTPVPITLQTLGVSLVAISLGSKRGASSIACYLCQASLGWPVLAGGLSFPFWILRPSAGYLIGFVGAAWLMGKLLENNPQASWAKKLCYMLSGELLILSVGTLWLMSFMGFKEAFIQGFIPFVIGGAMKAIVASTSIKPIAWCKGLFSK